MNLATRCQKDGVRLQLRGAPQAQGRSIGPAGSTGFHDEQQRGTRAAWGRGNGKGTSGPGRGEK
jgi:hypothetical protein